MFVTEININYAEYCRLLLARTITPSSHNERDKVNICLINIAPSLKNKDIYDDVLDLAEVDSKTQKLILEMFKIVDENYDEWLKLF